MERTITTCLVFQKEMLKLAEYENLRSELNLMGCITGVFDYKPHKDNVFSCSGNPDIEAAIGSIQFLKSSGRWLGNTLNGSLFTPELHYYSQYQFKIPSEIKLNNKSLVLPFSEIKRRGIKSLLESLGEPLHEHIFIKPDQSLKVCESTVESDSSWEHWCTYTSEKTGVQETSFIWFSPVKKIKKEYRCLISNKKATSASLYGFNVLPKNEDDNAALLDFASSAASSIELNDPSYMMDIAETDDGFKVIELNCLSTSGLYALNTKALANAWINALNYIYNDVMV